MSRKSGRRFSGKDMHKKRTAQNKGRAQNKKNLERIPIPSNRDALWIGGARLGLQGTNARPRMNTALAALCSKRNKLFKSTALFRPV
jgi:hypothetical protein